MVEPTFLLDGMLGTLAKWLRIMGYDALYVKEASDRRLLDMLEGNERFLLTRDHQLSERAGDRGLYVESDELDQQLLMVAQRFSLNVGARSTRCASCNGELMVVEKDAVRDKVPEGTLSSQQVFWACKDCGKVYWRGAHWKNIERRMDELSKVLRSSPR